jgi:2-haloacid dehalogenase
MNPVLAFDIYGTLIDPYSMEAHLEQTFGNKAKDATQIWRDKQIEFSFRRALMRRYVDFNVCTAQALDYVCQRFDAHLSGADRQTLLDLYLGLPAFPDAAPALRALSRRGYSLIAFSNGTESAVRTLLQRAAVLDLFSAIVSVNDVKSFKPDPVVYEYLITRSGAPKDLVWLVSSNVFDVIGAKSCGLRTAWVQRDRSSILDLAEFSPDVVVNGLTDLPTTLDSLLHARQSSIPH